MVRVFKALQNFVFLLATLFSVSAGASFVKKSASGLCHPPQSSWYERIKHYSNLASLEACLESGGKLPKGVTSASANDSQNLSDQYERLAFGHGWDDADGDCQNSRAEALISQSTTEVRFAGESRCRVVTGRWISPFTGNVIQNSSEIDIDHVVPLKWAWDRGAKTWSREERERFANEPLNLWPVELSLNRSKGAKGPGEWLPPTGQCGYVARFVRIVRQYDLQPSKIEAHWLKSFLENCRN